MINFNVSISLLPSCVNSVLSGALGLVSTQWVKDLQLTQEQVKQIKAIENQWVKDLQLTQEQVEQIKAIENQSSDQTSQFYQELQQIEISLARLIVSTASSDQLRQKEHELETLKIQAAHLSFEKFLAIRDVLTPSQLLRQCEHFTLTKEQRMEKFRSKNVEED